ncbi:cbb3-type cytochrome c oxidase subunit I [Methyloceanibacter sp.]|uniref:cbb3-type cytochrome c oxidase subunit I n=1 Tax=Methyloceanibacter sp. TaxID=1965321 RepID=UPI003D6CBCBD
MTNQALNQTTSERWGAGLAPIALLLAGAVFLLMMLVGLLMRSAQGNLVVVDPVLFYQLMTAHGVGMVGAAGLSGAAVMWYFLGRHVPLSTTVFAIFLGLFLLGVVLILGAIFVGGFAAAWTFLYPLPAHSGGAWSDNAAVAFLCGLVSIGVGFLLFYLEAGRAILARYGSLPKAMAWPLAFTGKMDDVPPPTVIASTAVIIFNSLGIVVGAAVLVISLINLLVPTFAVDALLAKNMIYFFGHVFINASIYMAVIGVYEVIPEYTGRPWKSSRAFAIAWTAILLFVLSVYPHHLMQDTVMPGWALILGQVVSYLSAIPVLAVTAFGLLGNVRGSGMRWDLASSLLFIGVFGWSIGVVPAVVDGVISANKLMHNTQWVPGHFHTYLLLGEVAMSFGVMAWLVRNREQATFNGLDRTAFWAYVAGSLGFILVLLTAGAMSVPRRWAVHAPEWIAQDRISSLFAFVIVLGATYFVVRYAIRLVTANGAR